MEIYVYNILKKIKLITQENIQLPYKNEFIQNLNALSYIEKDFIKKEVLKMNWNIGSGQMLVLLQNAEIITITDYILSKLNDEIQIALILNDLLKYEFSLLGNLIQHLQLFNPISIQIATHLETIFTRIINNLNENPEIIKCNYIKELIPYVTDSCLKTLELLHLKLFLDNSITNTNIYEAITKQMQWNNKFPINTILESILQSISSRKQLILEKLFEFVQKVEFSGWQYYLYFLRIITKQLNLEQLNVIKNFLKELFIKFLQSKCEQYFFILLITGRQLYFYNSNYDKDNTFGTYVQWFKNTIGDMKYRLKTDDFKYTMSVLTKMIPYECDAEIIKIHGTTTISTPQFCNEFVTIYKQMCLSSFNNTTSTSNTTNTLNLNATPNNNNLNSNINNKIIDTNIIEIISDDDI